MKNNINIKKIIKLSISIITILAIILFSWYKRNDFLQLANFNFIEITFLIFLNILSLFILSNIFRHTMLFFDLHFNFKEWFGLTVSNSMYNYLLPMRGGMAVRAFYLKQKYNFKYSEYAGFLSGFYVINFFTASLIATITSLAINIEINSAINFTYILFFICLSFFIIMYLGIFKKIFNSWKSKNIILSKIITALQSLQEYGHSYSELMKLIIFQVLFIISMATKLYFVFHFMDIPVNLLEIIFIQSLVVFSIIISVTPGNLGITEGIIGLSAGLLGVDYQTALMAAIVDRLLTMILVFILGIIFSRVLMRDFEVN